MGRRIGWLGIAMLVCFGALFVQLNNIQVAKAKKYATNAANPRIRAEQYSQPRGDIIASNGVTLATSVLAPKGSGLYKYERVYSPLTAKLFAQITGFDSLIYGQTGVESSYNSYLVAHNRPVKTIRDLLTTRTVTDNVTLTVDPTLQSAVYNALNDHTPAPHIGAAVVIDPSTGAIKAMYSNPTFDPNLLASPSTELEQIGDLAYNTPVPGVGGLTNGLSLAYGDAGFAPGSTFKTVTTSAAYDRTPQLVNKKYPSEACIKPGTLGGQTTQALCNFGATLTSPNNACGGDIAQMLPPSCDTGYALLGTDIGGQNMYQEASGFGFNQQPPIDLPHNTNQISNFAPPRIAHNEQIYLAYDSIGQFDTRASPLQMALVASAFANHGVIMTPHVMYEVVDSQGNLVTHYTPKPWLTATSPQTAAAVTGLMQQVVTHGTASQVGFLPQDDVAAKTGTAQTQNNTAINAWMIAFAPASHPKVAVAVMIPNVPDYLSPNGTGAQIAGPVMNQIIQAALSGA
jgi:peptidoglycan glycosyltransferase